MLRMCTSSCAHELICARAHLRTSSCAHELICARAHVRTSSCAHELMCARAHVRTSSCAHELICARAHLRTLMTRKLCPVGMRNAILRGHVKMTSLLTLELHIQINAQMCHYMCKSNRHMH